MDFDFSMAFRSCFLRRRFISRKRAGKLLDPCLFAISQGFHFQADIMDFLVGRAFLSPSRRFRVRAGEVWKRASK